MALTFDKEIEALLPMAVDEVEMPGVGDIESRRETFTRMFAPILSKNFPIISSVTMEDFHAKSSDGHEVLLRWYTKPGLSEGLPAVLFLHPGGLILGSVTLFDGLVQKYVDKAGVPYLSVEYRLAPENPYPKPLEDAYAGLVWLHDHASELNIDPRRIAVHGESAGGGLAAALSLLVREKQGPSISKQILIYPMLDDRTIKPNPYIEKFLVWSAADNETGWNAYLGEKRGSNQVPATAAPARIIDPRGLPAVYMEVGELDLFREEVTAYADKLGRSGVSTELHVYPDVPHGFEWFAPNSRVASDALLGRIRAIQSIPIVPSSYRKP
jgi:acetyl esterase/lipase